jgi:hypothetical protein
MNEISTIIYSHNGIEKVVADIWDPVIASLKPLTTYPFPHPSR